MTDICDGTEYKRLASRFNQDDLNLTVTMNTGKLYTILDKSYLHQSIAGKFQFWLQDFLGTCYIYKERTGWIMIFTIQISG
jgi:hypothetical protein